MGKPLKENELRELTDCRLCREKIGKKGVPILWKIQAERHGIDAKAMQRQTGLAMLLGGNGLLANAMGPNEDMTVLLTDETFMVCEECMVARLPEVFDGGE